MSTRPLIEWPWVQVPRGSLWLLSLKVRTSVSQAGDDGFKPYRSYCGHRIMAIRQSVGLPIEVHPLVIPHVWACLVAKTTDCKSITKNHRKFEFYSIRLCRMVYFLAYFNFTLEENINKYKQI